MFFRKRLTIKTKKKSDKATLPVKGTVNSAGYDLYASECTRIAPKSSSKVFTDLCFEIPKGYFGLISIRNSLSIKYDIQLTNCVAIIDSDYRGEIIIPVYNNSNKETCVIESGDRFAQLIILPSFNLNFKEKRKLSKSCRKNQEFCYDSFTGK